MGASSEEHGPEIGVVRLSDVHKVYDLGEPIPVLDGVSFTVERGSYTAIMGPSGSGKSTLLNLVGCLDRPTAGTLHVAGRDVTVLGDAERTRLRGEEIGFVFQTFNLMPKLTARENVALPLVFRGQNREQRREHARELLEKVGLGDRADHRPSQISGGQRQRVAIARALVNDPTLVLADEPTGSLDSETGRQIMGLFRQVHEAGNTLLVVTHERHIAEHAERIVHMLDGRIERIERVDSRRDPAPVPGEGTWTQ